MSSDVLIHSVEEFMRFCTYFLNIIVGVLQETPQGVGYDGAQLRQVVQRHGGAQQLLVESQRERHVDDGEVVDGQAAYHTWNEQDKYRTKRTSRGFTNGSDPEVDQEKGGRS